MQVLGKANIVTPIGTVLRFLQVPAVPAVGIFGGEQASVLHLMYHGM
jgi:hypothetical protein